MEELDLGLVFSAITAAGLEGVQNLDCQMLEFASQHVGLSVETAPAIALAQIGLARQDAEARRDAFISYRSILEHDPRVLSHRLRSVELAEERRFGLVRLYTRRIPMHEGKSDQVLRDGHTLMSIMQMGADI